MSNIMKLMKYLISINLLLAGLLSTNSYAGCLFGKQSVRNGPITLAIDPNAEVGEELAQRNNNELVGKMMVITCTTNSNYSSSSPLTPSTTYPGAFETGIPGVGVLISDLWNPAKMLPQKVSGLTPSDLTTWTNNDNIRLRFVKTGPIANGSSVGSQVVARFSLDNKPMAELTLARITVIQKSCLVDVHSRRQTIDLGNPPKSEFNGIGSVARSSERSFNIKINCESDDIPIDISFDAVGTSPGPGMINIRQQEQAASGVVVEVLDKNHVPILFGEEKTYHSKREMNIDIPMTAHYKKTGEIKTGKADAAMTFTLTQN
ncbi:fimbrial protein [Erwiniaceae bacterium CAU 1747]